MSLVVVVPPLTATLRPRRDSVRAQLVRAGLLAATVYTYAQYLFGTGFNSALLVHVAVFASSLAALALTVVSLDLSVIARRVDRGMAERAVSAVLGVLALGLGVMWVVASLRFAFTRVIPEGSVMVETDTIVRLGIVLDPTLLVPLYGLASIHL